CSDDDDDNPISPGDLNDPNFQVFSSEFEDIDEMTGRMLVMMFEMIDVISIDPSSPAVLAAPEAPWDVEWHAASNYWVGTRTEYEESDTMHFTDSVQFRHGATVVQYPNDDSLTEVRSYFTLVANGPEINTGVAHQNLVLTRSSGDSDTLVLNGTQSFVVDALWDDVDGTDTTYYAVDNSTTSAFTNILWDTRAMFDEEEEELNCPLSGSIAHTATVDITVSGAATAHVTGQWTVTQVFDHGEIAITVSNGSTNWSMTEDCDTGTLPGEILTGADSAFVDEALGGEMLGSFMNSTEFTMGLLDYIPGIPGSSGKSAFRALAADTVIFDSLSYTYGSGWHIFYVEAMVISEDGMDTDSTWVQGIDSIQILVGGAVVQFPPSTEDSLSGVNFRAHVDIENSDEFGGSMAHRVDIVQFADGADTLLEVNATTSDTLSSGYWSEGVVCAFDATSNAVVTDLVMDPDAEAECPHSGSISAVSTVELYCEGTNPDVPSSYNINGTWTVGVVANGNNTVTVSFSNGLVSWSMVTDCE
ncbi:MAG: hypothetical protein KKA42_05190, partial [candidate division Zixibacteria bacterium]|nr:hypothetical protein [candidate division Zixibacteria bacterium]